MSKASQDARAALRFLYNTIHRLDTEITQLTEQKLAAKTALELLEKQSLVCGYCGGSGTLMYATPGTECDGPRQHLCGRCRGTGEPI